MGLREIITWYPERVSFIRRNTHKYKYKFFSYKKVAPKVAPFFIDGRSVEAVQFDLLVMPPH